MRPRVSFTVNKWLAAADSARKRVGKNTIDKRICMKKKVLISLAMLVVIGTSTVFAQKVGETIQVSSQTYRVESNSGGKVVLQLVPSLNGVLSRSDNPGVQISVNGSNGTYSSINSSGTHTLDAMNKGNIKVGGQVGPNIRSTGYLTWSGQNLSITAQSSAPDVATGTAWTNTTITMSADGRTITVTGAASGRGSYTETFTR